jgi:hypothetical protein
MHLKKSAKELLELEKVLNNMKKTKKNQHIHNHAKKTIAVGKKMVTEGVKFGVASGVLHMEHKKLLARKKRLLKHRAELEKDLKDLLKESKKHP